MSATAESVTLDSSAVEQMPNEKTNGNVPSYLGIILAAASLVSGVLGGFIGAIGTASQWKGEIQTKLEYIEKQRAEDKAEYRQALDYWRTQNEVIGKQLASITATLDAKRR
jgi:hypothetical protein